MHRPITRLQRWFFRLPIVAFRARMGWMFGSRLLMLTHTGRRSGQPRRTVLEVPLRDGRDTYYIASGWGTGADWYRNLSANRSVRVMVGSRSFMTSAELLDPVESGQLMVRYHRERPRLAAALAESVGWGRKDEIDWDQLGRDKVPWVRLRVGRGAPPIERE